MRVQWRGKSGTGVGHAKVLYAGTTWWSCARIICASHPGRKKTKIRTLQSILYKWMYIYMGTFARLIAGKARNKQLWQLVVCQTTISDPELPVAGIFVPLSLLTCLHHREETGPTCQIFLLAWWHNNVTTLKVVSCELGPNNTSKRVLFHLPQGGNKDVLASPCLRADLMLIVFIYSRRSG